MNCCHMSVYLEGVQAGAEPGPPHRPSLGEAEDIAQGREVSGAAVWDRAGVHTSLPSIANDFQYRGRRGGTGGVGIGV